MFKTTFIYGLLDPVTGEVRYIGKSLNPQQRLINHLVEVRKGGYKNKKTAWLKSLLNKGLKPQLEILDEIPESEWQFWEMYYISLYKSWGFDLKNGDNGGLGSTRLSPEIRQKISNTLKGNVPWNKGTKRTLEEREKQKLTAPNKKKVAQYTKEGVFIQNFDSLAEAARKTGCSNYSLISNAIRRNKSCIANGYKWSYLEEKDLV